MKAIIIIAGSALIVQAVSAQEINVPSVSIYGGGFVSAQRNFSSTYGSSLCFSSGGSARFPLAERFFALVKASYIFKSNYGYELRQWVTDIGPGYIWPVSEDFYLTASAGLGYSIFLSTFPIVTAVGSTNGDLNYGVFANIGAERYIPGVSSSVYLEAYYSFLPRRYTAYLHNFGGAEFVVGFRYHFNISTKP